MSDVSCNTYTRRGIFYPTRLRSVFEPAFIAAIKIFPEVYAGISIRIKSCLDGLFTVSIIKLTLNDASPAPRLRCGLNNG